ncbi:protein tyrosine phosphatase [Paenibacillus swuensis]|uniref:Protein tyrosine phosphatase n=2 Tax=Paenibacillus swuensis TaxID=1178515 RepID=A0A172TNM6_9BACL|nr:protein tyrosine phosphatase [Paenibacillus swuensis]
MVGALTPVAASAAPAPVQGHFSAASVERSNHGKMVIHWKTSSNLGPAKIYWSTSPDNIESDGKLLAHTYTSFGGYVTADPKPGFRVYFKIKAGNGATVTTAERKVNLQGAFNFRDLGGYRTTDGKTVKWGKLYRAEELGHLTPKDLAYVERMGLKTNVDYRNDSEVKAMPDPVLKGVKYVRTDQGNTGSGADLNSIMASGMLKDEQTAVGLLVMGNKSMIEKPEPYVTLMELLNEKNNMALVQHCTAGKDRTGVGSAVILLALGVDEKTVMEDYLLSNVYRAEANKMMIEGVKQKVKDENMVKAITALMGVQKEFLGAAIQEMKTKYGSIDVFLEQGLGITKQERAQLKAMYLE